MNHIPKVQDLERAHGLTWGQLVGLEPQLEKLLWQARAAGARCRCWQDVKRVFAPFAGTLAELIGFCGRYSRHPLLGSVGAYDIAYWRLHEAVCGLLPRPAGTQDTQEVTPALEDLYSARSAAVTRCDTPALQSDLSLRVAFSPGSTTDWWTISEGAGHSTSEPKGNSKTPCVRTRRPTRSCSSKSTPTGWTAPSHSSK
jgi:hypothetical protein